MSPTILKLAIDDVMRPQPWPIVLEDDGHTIVSGRPDARTIVGWVNPNTIETSMTPKVGSTPIFSDRAGAWFTIPGLYLREEPTPYTSNLEPLREMEERYRAAFDRT